VDVVLVGFIAAFAFGGWRSGLLRRLIGIGFTVLAFVVGAYLRYPFAAIATSVSKNIPTDYANLVGYAIAFPAILAALHLVSNRLLAGVKVQGITKEVDSGLGALFGGLEAILVLSAAVVVLDAYFGTGATPSALTHSGMLKDLTAQFNASTTVHLLRDTTVPIVLAILGPLLPTDVKSLLPNGLPSSFPGIPGGVPGASGLPLP
jgi:uncharacterized membrane protein required for colicin V production